MKIKLRIPFFCNYFNLFFKYISIALFNSTITSIKSKTGLLLIFLLSTILNTQAQEDSLKNKSYEYLLNKINTLYNSDTIITNIYTRAYLKKAKKNNDSIRITEGYYYLSQNTSNSKSLQLIEYALNYNKGNESLSNKLNLLLYFSQGNLYYKNDDYKKALESYLRAKKYQDNTTQKYLVYTIEHNIGLIKLNIGSFKEAQESFKKSYDYLIENSLQEKYSKDYLSHLFTLSLSYLRNNKIDSAAFYNNIGLIKAKKYKSEYHNTELRVMEAIINYNKKEYQIALDSISKYIPIMEESNSLLDMSIPYLYQGKAYKDLGDWDNALLMFKKVDTIIQRNKNKYTIDIRDNYQILYEYYKSKGDAKNHILYIERLLDLDSTLYANNAYLKSTILNKFDAPKLIEEKEVLIAKLKSKDYRKSRTVYIMSIVIFILLSLLLYYYKKKQIYKKRFEKVMENKPINSVSLPNVTITKKELKVPNDIIEEVLKKLKTFEREQQFLSNTINLNSLAKKLGTNSAYLSKIVNFHKNQNFSTYLSDLRINYVVDALKTQPKLREYTIKAIAFEVGFKNSESFTNAFYKKTKLYPSYFIKELEKRDK